jgi:hypothetical protein
MSGHIGSGNDNGTRGLFFGGRYLFSEKVGIASERVPDLFTMIANNQVLFMNLPEAKPLQDHLKELLKQAHNLHIQYWDNNIGQEDKIALSLNLLEKLEQINNTLDMVVRANTASLKRIAVTKRDPDDIMDMIRFIRIAESPVMVLGEYRRELDSFEREVKRTLEALKSAPSTPKPKF